MGARLLACVTVMLALPVLAAAQPVPVPAPRASVAPQAVPAPVPAPSNDPIGDLLKRVGAGNAAGTPAPPVVIGLRLGETATQSRFVIEISDPVKLHVFTLANPNRVVIDMPQVLWRVADAARPSGKDAIKSYRYGLFRPGDSRFVIDLNKPVMVEKPEILPPENGYSFRIVLNLTPTSLEDFVAHAGWPKEDRAPAAAPPAAPQEAPPAVAETTPRPGRKKIVVVDPGHGGIDPGTHGAHGLLEKNVVLAVGKKLRAALRATGRYEVKMTRDTDVFIPLRKRVEIARADHADLFVSLHADSIDHPEIRGASVYTLSEDASDREAAKLAEKENMSDVIAGVDLSGENSPVASILIDLAQRDTINRSIRFAEDVLGKLPEATLVRPSSPHRSAGFAVLKAPDVPAVLIELGYLSNTKDAHEMATNTWRVHVADAIRDAINAYFAAQTAVPERQAANP